MLVKNNHKLHLKKKRKTVIEEEKKDKRKEMGWLLLTHNRRRTQSKRTFGVGDVCALRAGCEEQHKARASIGRKKEKK